MASGYPTPASEDDAAPLAFKRPRSPTVAYPNPGPPTAVHIAKYIAQFPTTRILLVRCPLSRVWLP
ncbi:hypothetical protein TOPH_02714 [Tolypocladium ophioglossoides CBS 100239]|uniref:Uncharacterized protein n=1 Tax=Tolypocladium ophioglossoides (strain CBS 100239) TaxID=1163406 RepID=A0A0L0NE59_TOLOC|nr:hypothetical protein TOPH_02714 [Tolypocladium ophioglossoides CBS 100239]